MPQNASAVRATHHRQLRLVPETVVGTLDLGAAPILCDDLNAPFTAKIVAGRKEHTPQGANGAAYVARHRQHVEISGLSIDPDYNAMKKWLEAIYARVSKTTANGKDRYVYRKRPYGGANVQSFSANYGLPEDSDTATSFFVGDMEIGSGRKNEPSGSLSGFARRPTKGGGLIGATPQSAILQILAANVAGDGVFAYKVGSAAPVNVTHSIGDTIAQTIAKLAAVGLTASVAGLIALGSGEKHVLTATSANGNASIYGGTIAVTSGMTAAALQTAIQAKGGVYAGAQVTGSTTPAGGGEVAAGNPTITSTPTVLDLGTAKIVTQVRALSGGGSPSPTTTIRGSNDNFATSVVLGVFNGVGGTFNIPVGNQGAYRYLSLATGSPSDSYNTAGGFFYTTAPSASNGAYTVQYPAAAGNVPDIEVNPGTGWTGASTQPGAAGGTLTITANGASANTPVSVTPVIGNPVGWALQPVQAGSNGQVVPLPVSPITASDWAIRRAPTYALLSAGGAALLISAAYDYKLKVADIYAPHYTANETETFDRVKRGKVLHTAEISLDDTNDGHLAQIEAGADDSANRTSKPDWYEFGHRSGDGLSSLLYRLCMAISDDFDPQDEEDVEGKSLKLIEIAVGAGEEFCVEVVLEVPAGTFAD